MPNIRYHSLRFKNGFAYRECELPFDNQGLVLVRGLNLDDGGFLGAGKTSLFDVFSLLQTGKIGKQRKGERILADDVVNLSVGAGFEARLRFDVDGHPYEIVQCRKHHRWGNAYRIIDVDAGKNILPHSSRKKPQLWALKNILNLDEKSFFNLVYMAQDFSNVMLHGTDGDRQQNLIKIFGLDAYDDLLARTKQKLSSLQVTARDIDTLQEELRSIDTQLQEFTETPDELLLRLEAARQQQLDLQQRHDAALDQQETLQERLRALETRRQYIKDIKDLWSTLPEPPLADVREVDRQLVDSTKTEVAALERRLLDLMNSIRLVDQRSIIERRLSTLGSCDPDATQLELTSTRDELRRLTNEELPRAEQRLELIQDIRSLQKPLRSTTVVREELEAAKDLRHDAERGIAEIKQALNNDICPTCKRPYDADACSVQDYEAQLKRVQQQLRDYSTDVHDLTAELKNTTEYEDLKAKIEAIGASANTTDIQKQIGRLSQEESRLVGLLEAENIRSTLERQLADLPAESTLELQKQKKATEAALDKSKLLLDVVRRVYEKLAKLRLLPKGKVAAVKQRLIEAGRTIREANNDIIALGTELGSLERRHEKLSSLATRKLKIEHGIAETKTTQTEIKCLEGLKKAFGPSGLKRERFRSILADATEQTVPYYTRLLWPKRNVELALAEEGSAVKFELHREGLVTGSRLLSGGERNKAGLSLLFGMRDLKEKYTGLQTNLLILDEPFGNLDAYGTSCLLGVLAELRRRFGTVMVIGNQNDVLASDEWDQTWWVIRENDEARLYRDGLPDRYAEAAIRYTVQPDVER